MTTLDIGFSPCPNDTAIFHAMTHGLVDTQGLTFTPNLCDVGTLNQKAFQGTYPITKLSLYAYLCLKDTYEILESGAALGYECGPLLVGREKDIPEPDARIAVPGEHTTAHLLFQLWGKEYKNIHVTRFDKIMEGVQKGEFDAGVIIHEGRFVYEKFGLKRMMDLGKYWERRTGGPIPLGCIAIKKDPELLEKKPVIESVLKESVKYAMENRAASREYVKTHAQEMDDAVIDAHLDLYVNDFTLELGEKGHKAIEELRYMAACRNLV